MNILHLTTVDSFSHGSVVSVCRTLHEQFKRSGHTSKIVVSKKESSDEDVIQVYTLGHRLSRHLSRSVFDQTIGRDTKGKINVDFNFGNLSSASIVRKLPFRPDVILVYWVSHFVTSKHIYEISKATGAPVVWYMMDMAPYTSGCHYSLGCDRYVHECGLCPIMESNQDDDWSRWNWKNKNRFLQETNIVFVSASTDQFEKVSRSSLAKGKRKELIYLGIDPEIFKPANKTAARKTLGLPPERRIIYAGSVDPREERKGTRFLIEALNTLKQRYNQFEQTANNILFVTAGKDHTWKGIVSDFEQTHVGFLKSKQELASMYQASDVFVSPSIDDAGPSMINECVMCGTPVVSFDIGVARDLVVDGITGYKAKLKDSNGLAAGIDRILSLSSEEYQEMSANCRKLGIEKCHPEIQNQRFLRLFQSLIAQ